MSGKHRSLQVVKSGPAACCTSGTRPTCRQLHALINYRSYDRRTPIDASHSHAETQPVRTHTGVNGAWVAAPQSADGAADYDTKYCLVLKLEAAVLANIGQSQVHTDEVPLRMDRPYLKARQPEPSTQPCGCKEGALFALMALVGWPIAALMMHEPTDTWTYWIWAISGWAPGVVLLGLAGKALGLLMAGAKGRLLVRKLDSARRHGTANPR